MRTSGSVDALFSALVDANLLLVNPVKGSTADAGAYSYKYADLPTILDQVRPVLHAHGLVIAQDTHEAERGVGITTVILHRSGEWVEFGPLIMPTGDARAIGSAITYGRRYQLLAALGIAADEDDDGKALAASTWSGAVEPAAPKGTKAGPPAAAGKSLDGGGDVAAAHGEGVNATDGGSPPPSDVLAQLLEVVGGSEVKAINAVNKAVGGAYRKADLENLTPDEYAAGLAAVTMGRDT